MLYIVPTPIGNFGDITIRALDVLRDVDIILAEDTRKSKQLLNKFEIEGKKLIPYHKFNEHKQLEQYVSYAKLQDVALVTDAGTPGISDPGFLLVRACIKEDIEVLTLPGATAFVPALVNSGIPCDKFFFEGFLPHKKGRQKRIKFIAELEYTLVLYESPYRLLKTLEQIAEEFGGERYCAVSREISKIYEETVRGTIQEVINHFKQNTPKGEFVIVIDGKSD